MKVKNIGLPHHITVSAEVLQKFGHILYSKYDLEFTAFCHAEKREGGEFHIYDIFFPEQVNSSALTECDGSDLVALMGDGADISKLTGHMHSHVNMATGPSGTDEREILERAEQCGYNVALILNKKGAIFGHIADYNAGVYLQDVPVKVIYPADFEAEMLDMLKSLDSLDKVQEFIDYGIDFHFEDHRPLSTEYQEFLDEVVIKKRFTRKFSQPSSTTTYPITTTNVTTSQANSGIASAAESARTFMDNGYGLYEDKDLFEQPIEDDFDYPEDPNDYFNEEEMDMILDAMKKSTPSLTDEEFKLLTEYDTIYGAYAQ